MNGLVGRLSAVAGPLLLATWATAAPRLVPAPSQAPTSYPAATAPRSYPAAATETLPAEPGVVPASAPSGASEPGARVEISSVTVAPAGGGADPELQRLLDRLTALSEAIGRNGQAADIWRSQLEQAGVLFRIAERSKAEEQTNWLRMAVDAYYSAALQSPANDITASKQLAQLPDRITAEFPKNPAATYADLQVVEADYARAVARDGEHADQALAQLHDNLLHFVKAHPDAPEAAKAVEDAAGISERLGKIDNARICYRYLTEHFAGQAVARKAGGSLWRLGLAGEEVRLALPLLFAPPLGDHTFDLKELRGKLVAVYFWSSAAPEAADDLQTLKDLAVKYQDRGLEVVYVNMDDDMEKVRTFLAGRLTVGTHLYQQGGLGGPVAERYGIQTLPQTFLVGRDGGLIHQSMQASQLDAEISGRVPHDR